VTMPIWKTIGGIAVLLIFQKKAVKNFFAE